MSNSVKSESPATTSNFSRDADLPWMILVTLVICVVVGIVYSPSLYGPFVFDDLNNIQSAESLHVFPPRIEWSNPLARPVTAFTFAWDWWRGNGETSHFHATNIVLHCIAAVLLLDVVRLFLERFASDKRNVISAIPREKRWVVAAVCVLLWALHPLVSSTVCYIVQRSEILASIGMIAAVDFFLRFDRSRHWSWVVLIVLAVVCGAFAKVNAVAIIPLLLLLQWQLPEARDVRKTGLSFKAIWFPIVVGIVFATLVAWIVPKVLGGAAGVGYGGEELTTKNYLFTQAKVIWLYALSVVLPGPTCIDYQERFITDWFAAIPWLMICFFTGIVVLVLLLKRKLEGWLLAGYFLLLAPTSSFIPIIDARFDHRAYFASFFLIAFLCAIASRIAESSAVGVRSYRVVKWVAIAVLLLMVYRTTMKTSDWSDGFSVWRSTCEVAPENTRALQNLTNVAIRERRIEDLVLFLDGQRERLRDQGYNVGAICSRLGEIQLQQGLLTESEKQLLAAVSLLDPNSSRWDREELAAAHFNLGLLGMQSQRLDEAFASFQASITTVSANPIAFAMLAQIEEKRGNSDEAITFYDQAIELNPDFFQAIKDRDRLKMELQK